MDETTSTVATAGGAATLLSQPTFPMGLLGASFSGSKEGTSGSGGSSGGGSSAASAAAAAHAFLAVGKPGKVGGVVGLGGPGGSGGSIWSMPTMSGGSHAGPTGAGSLSSSASSSTAGSPPPGSSSPPFLAAGFGSLSQGTDSKQDEVRHRAHAVADASRDKEQGPRLRHDSVVSRGSDADDLGDVPNDPAAVAAASSSIDDDDDGGLKLDLSSSGSSPIKTAFFGHSTTSTTTAPSTHHHHHHHHHHNHAFFLNKTSMTNNNGNDNPTNPLAAPPGFGRSFFVWDEATGTGSSGSGSGSSTGNADADAAAGGGPSFLPLPPPLKLGRPQKSSCMETTTRLLLPSWNIGRIIGKGGDVITGIRELSGAHITIMQSGTDNRSIQFRMVSISGPIPSVALAVQLIGFQAGVFDDDPAGAGGAGGLLGFGGGGGGGGGSGVSGVSGVSGDMQQPPAPQQLDDPGIRMIIDASLVGQLLGRKGRRVQDIRAQTGVRRIQILNAEESRQEGGVRSERILLVLGNGDQCRRAHMLISVILEMDPVQLQQQELSQVPLHQHLVQQPHPQQLQQMQQQIQQAYAAQHQHQHQLPMAMPAPVLSRAASSTASAAPAAAPAFSLPPVAATSPPPPMLQHSLSASAAASPARPSLTSLLRRGGGGGGGGSSSSMDGDGAGSSSDLDDLAGGDGVLPSLRSRAFTDPSVMVDELTGSFGGLMGGLGGGSTTTMHLHAVAHHDRHPSAGSSSSSSGGLTSAGGASSPSASSTGSAPSSFNFGGASAGYGGMGMGMSTTAAPYGGGGGGGMGMPLPPASMGATGGFGAASYEAKDMLEFSAEVILRISNDNIGRLIGKEGCIIRRIRQESQCRIEIDNCPPTRDYTIRVVRIRGHVQQTHMATALILQQMMAPPTM